MKENNGPSSQVIYDRYENTVGRDKVFMTRQIRDRLDGYRGRYAAYASIDPNSDIKIRKRSLDNPALGIPSKRASVPPHMKRRVIISSDDDSST